LPSLVDQGLRQRRKIVDAVYVGPAPTDPTITNALPGAYTAALTG
jgi:hypothetical protein